jgi:hypothetical protein
MRSKEEGEGGREGGRGGTVLRVFFAWREMYARRKKK